MAAPAIGHFGELGGQYGLTLEGSEELVQVLDAVSRDIQLEVRGALVRASLSIMEEVKRRMPVETGRARAGWGIWRRKDMSYYSPASKRIRLPKGVNRKGVYDTLIPVRDYSGVTKSGLARFTPGRSEGMSQAKWLKQFMAASPADAIWIEKTANNSGSTGDIIEVVQGTNLPYVELLNDGRAVRNAAGKLTGIEQHTEQAEIGFIDTAYRKGAKTLQDELIKVLDKAMSGMK